MKSSFAVLLCGWLLLGLPAGSASGLSIAPLTYKVEPDEIVWFGATGTQVITCTGNGAVRIWDLDSGKLNSEFRLIDYSYPNDDLAVSRGKVGDGKLEIRSLPLATVTTIKEIMADVDVIYSDDET